MTVAAAVMRQHETRMGVIQLNGRLWTLGEMAGLQVLECWRPVRESNACRRRKRDANHCNSLKLCGMNSTLPHLKDSRGRILDCEDEDAFVVDFADLDRELQRG